MQTGQEYFSWNKIIISRKVIQIKCYSCSIMICFVLQLLSITFLLSLLNNQTRKNIYNLWQAFLTVRIIFLTFKTVAYFVRTIATASFRMLSPNTNMFNNGSAFNAWKIANVATGSTAEINEPNAKLNNSKFNQSHQVLHN